MFLNIKFLTVMIAFSMFTGAVSAQDAREMPPASDITIDYDKHIKPLFEAKCNECHNEKKKKSKLRLDTRDFVLQGGVEGPSVIIGDSENSIMIKILLGTLEDYEMMPPSDEYDAFTDEEIGLVRAWIDQGLVWGADSIPAHPVEASVPGLPADWKAQATNQKAELATWGLINDFKGPAGEQLIGLSKATESGNETLNLMWTPKAAFKDGSISLKFKATGGSNSAGIAWRIKDHNNYYFAMLESTSKSLIVAEVKDGKTNNIGKTVSNKDIPEWVTLKITQTGNNIKAVVEGVEVVGENSSFSDAGGVGYITVGDSTAAFTAFNKKD